jgi:hypothetical protein
MSAVTPIAVPPLAAMFAFSAVRTTHADGAGCLLTVRHDAKA